MTDTAFVRDKTACVFEQVACTRIVGYNEKCDCIYLST